MADNQLLTKAQGDYPSVTGIAKNCNYANILLNDYAGPAGEVTAVMQYMYQYYLVDEFEASAAKTLEEIAISEMHHHELLGKTIVALGGTPMYISSAHSYWSARCVDYTGNYIKMLMSDIEGEKLAIANYRRSIAKIFDEKVQEILLRIILDEEVHVQTLTELLQRAKFYAK